MHRGSGEQATQRRNDSASNKGTTDKSKKFKESVYGTSFWTASFQKCVCPQQIRLMTTRWRGERGPFEPSGDFTVCPIMVAWGAPIHTIISAPKDASYRLSHASPKKHLQEHLFSIPKQNHPSQIWYWSLIQTYLAIPCRPIIHSLPHDVIHTQV